MKKNYLLIIIVTFLMVSCTQVNRRDVFSLAEVFEASMQSGNINKIKPYYQHKMDSLSKFEKKELDEILTFYKNKKIKKIEVDTSNSWWNFCDISYLLDNTYYEVSFSYQRDSHGMITLDGLSFNNIHSSCSEAEEIPYCPKSQISFKRISWTTDYYEKTFKSGAVELQNNTDLDINYIKFRVTLAKGSGNYFSANPFFNQTVESFKPIYKGDIVTIEVPGLNDYFAGFRIEKENLQFNAELIEIKPKPLSGWCLKIKKLDEKVKTIIANK